MAKWQRLFQAIPELISRFMIGLIFIQSGWGKLHHLSDIVSYFESLHIPFPQLQAPFVASVELVAGSMIFLGLCTRLASLPLIGVMGVALLTAKAEDITDLSTLFDQAEFLYIIILIWLAAYGAKTLSVDAVLCPHMKKWCRWN